VNWELHRASAVSGAEQQKPEEDMPPVTYWIAGTWAEWLPAPMLWDGECFYAMVRIGSRGWEAFQFCVEGSWDKVVYPSIKDANPYRHFEFKGPDNRNKGYNWVIGRAGMNWLGHDIFAPGTRCKVKLFVDSSGKPKRMGWDLYTGERADRPTLICFAGLASGSLEVVPSTGSKSYVGWCRVKELVKHPKKVLRALSLKLEDGRLKDGRTVKCTACVSDEFHVRPVKGIQGIKSLSPPGSIQIPVWGPLVDQLEGDFNWHAFSYDWRRWGDEKFAEETLERFRQEVEDIIRHDRPSSGKASLIGHSMGTTVMLYLLSVVGDSWVKKHIDQIILVAPAHMGSPSMVSSYAHCPFVDTQSWMPVPGIFDQTLGDLTATWACMIAEMPVKVGGVAPWPEDHVFAITPGKQYRLADIGEFLVDLAACKQHRESGPALWPSVCRLTAAVRPPQVPTTIIYGAGVDTPNQVEYEDCNLGRAPKLSSTVPGDGTIVAYSVETVARAWQAKGSQVRLLQEPPKEGTSHKSLICCTFTAAIVPAVLTHRKLTPIEVIVVSASGLRNADTGLAGVSDPYCRIHVPGKPSTVRQTEVVMNCLDPEWNYSDIIYAYTEGDQLMFTVYDMDSGCTDGDLLGRVMLSAQQVRAGFDGNLYFDGDPGSLRVKVTALPHI